MNNNEEYRKDYHNKINDIDAEIQEQVEKKNKIEDRSEGSFVGTVVSFFEEVITGDPSDKIAELMEEKKKIIKSSKISGNSMNDSVESQMLFNGQDFTQHRKQYEQSGRERLNKTNDDIKELDSILKNNKFMTALGYRMTLQELHAKKEKMRSYINEMATADSNLWVEYRVYFEDAMEKFEEDIKDARTEFELGKHPV